MSPKPHITLRPMQDRSNIHRGGVVCRDFAIGVERAAKSLSLATLDAIKAS
jgi:hypothetical protein